MNATIRSRSGRPLDELTIEALRAGSLDAGDFAIGREQLEHQARVAEEGRHPQLADNLRRAAELTGLSNERVFEIYELLRPERASYETLVELSRSLASRQMPRLAAFVAEAADAYRARGITARR